MWKQEVKGVTQNFPQNVDTMSQKLDRQENKKHYRLLFTERCFDLTFNKNVTYKIKDFR